MNPGRQTEMGIFRYYYYYWYMGQVCPEVDRRTS
jgi:hypothetical protein